MVCVHMSTCVYVHGIVSCMYVCVCVAASCGGLGDHVECVRVRVHHVSLRRQCKRLPVFLTHTRNTRAHLPNGCTHARMCALTYIYACVCVCAYSPQRMQRYRREVAEAQVNTLAEELSERNIEISKLNARIRALTPQSHTPLHQTRASDSGGESESSNSRAQIQEPVEGRLRRGGGDEVHQQRRRQRQQQQEERLAPNAHDVQSTRTYDGVMKHRTLDASGSDDAQPTTTANTHVVDRHAPGQDVVTTTDVPVGETSAETVEKARVGGEGGVGVAAMTTTAATTTTTTTSTTNNNNVGGGGVVRGKRNAMNGEARAAVVYPYVFEMSHEALEASVKTHMDAVQQQQRQQHLQQQEETIFLKIAS